MSNKLYICLPVLNEYEQMSALLVSLYAQTYQNFKLIACVNQPESWWEDVIHVDKCLNNQKTIKILKSSELDIEIIDKSSKGKGWMFKKKGVGWARKLCMDYAAEQANRNDLIVSIDADTYYPPQYFQSLIDVFKQNINGKKFTVLSNPYYHPLTGKESVDKAILRYEIYMRLYHINMMQINNPYAFTAIGSAMICSAAQYKKMGGISPKHSGEDFYFVQNMRKNGPVHQYNTIKVFPQARFSDRVNFGTGPAMIKGDAGDWSSYPFYLPQQFLDIKKTYNSFSELFEKDIETPMSSFLKMQLKKDSPWLSLRKNSKTKEKFEQACMQLVDGLRILQFLKSEYGKYSKGEESDLKENLENLLNHHQKYSQEIKSILKSNSSIFSFKKSKELRDILEKIELSLRFDNPII